MLITIYKLNLFNFGFTYENSTKTILLPKAPVDGQYSILRSFVPRIVPSVFLLSVLHSKLGLFYLQSHNAVVHPFYLRTYSTFGAFYILHLVPSTFSHILLYLRSYSTFGAFYILSLVFAITVEGGPQQSFRHYRHSLCTRIQNTMQL
jgi:hypothetical protein